VLRDLLRKAAGDKAIIAMLATLFRESADCRSTSSLLVMATNFLLGAVHQLWLYLHLRPCPRRRRCGGGRGLLSSLLV